MVNGIKFGFPLIFNKKLIRSWPGLSIGFSKFTILGSK
jgi:hypothetical protein